MKYKFVKLQLTAFIVNFIQKGISLQLMQEILKVIMWKQIVHIFVIYAGALSTSWFHLWSLISNNGWVSGQTFDLSHKLIICCNWSWRLRFPSWYLFKFFWLSAKVSVENIQFYFFQNRIKASQYMKPRNRLTKSTLPIITQIALSRRGSFKVAMQRLHSSICKQPLKMNLHCLVLPSLCLCLSLQLFL